MLLVLQARLRSSRLPAKALLPLAGLPSSVLAARRASNRGADLVAATSEDPCDDALADAWAAHGLRVVRGPLDDVLARFELATLGLDDDAVVVRLTADNVFPDGDFVSALVGDLRGRDLGYLSTSWPEGGLPFGLSAEAFRVSLLRRAAREASDPFDREHVGPWMKRCGPAGVFDALAPQVDLARLRCTLDSLDDYLRLHRVFEGEQDAVGVSWRELCRRLAALPDAPRLLVRGRPLAARAGPGRDARRHAELVLGTASLGRPGGFLRRVPPSPDEARAIVRRAIEHGVSHVDTARAYGSSEATVGAALDGGWAGRAHVVTKLDPLEALPGAPPETVRRAVDASVFRSCRELRTRSLSTLLLHRASHLSDWHGAAWQRLQELRKEGVIERLGVSVQHVGEALAALANPDVLHLQLPYNTLDWRWDEAGIPERIAERPEIVVHARSALLQGVLARSEPEAWPAVAGLDPRAIIAWLADETRRLGRRSVADLCLGYVRGQAWIDGVAVGIETLDQLDANVELFSDTPLSPQACSELRRRRPIVPEALLDPARWPRAPAHDGGCP